LREPLQLAASRQIELSRSSYQQVRELLSARKEE
jgi:hypothetical protein